MRNKKLLNERIFKKAAFQHIEEIIKHEDHPLEKIILKGYAKEHNFYENLAHILDVPLLKEIPLNLTPTGAVSSLIPAEIAIEHQILVYESNGAVWFAAATPFIAQETVDLFSAFLGQPLTHFSLAPPNTLRSALAFAYRHELDITATDRIEVLKQDYSSRHYRTLLVPYVFPLGFLAFYALGLWLWPFPLVLGTFITLNVIYFFLNPFKIYVFSRSFQPTHLIQVKEEEINSITDDELPIYTILVPLKNEAAMVPQLVKYLFALNYPREKLDIKFITEVNDTTTIAALHAHGIGQHENDATPEALMAEHVKVPIAELSTKPRSCNYALSFARGSFIVIYDAEDRPDPDQLKKAIAAFRRSALTTVCVQARLNFYNTKRNILTRLFSLEYGFWYDFYLPGSQEVGGAIPLGGTSNHFPTKYLKGIGGWDPYNVTEDADLGVRIYDYGLITALVNSYTLEEANSLLGNWIRQRTRWEKGFFITFLVHAAHPIKAIKSVGLKRYASGLFTVGSNFFLPLFNPLLWCMFAASFLPFSTFLSVPIPTLLFRYIGIFNLIIGNLSQMIVHAVVAVKRRQLYLLPYIPLLPIYWLFISVACYRALWQFVRSPYRWEKTRHAL